jgi:hypothetical protein
VKKLGRVAKGEKCCISNCKKEAVRSLSASKVKSSGLNIDSGIKRAFLCRNHYKEFKKKIKKEKKIEQWRYKSV